MSALVLRIEGGYAPSADDLRALIGSGCTRDELRAALERNRSKTERFSEALELLATL